MKTDTFVRALNKSNGSVFNELTFAHDLNVYPYFRGIAGRDVWDHITISAVELQFRLLLCSI